MGGSSDPDSESWAGRGGEGRCRGASGRHFHRTWGSMAIRSFPGPVRPTTKARRRYHPRRLRLAIIPTTMYKLTGLALRILSFARHFHGKAVSEERRCPSGMRRFVAVFRGRVPLLYVMAVIRADGVVVRNSRRGTNRGRYTSVRLECLSPSLFSVDGGCRGVDTFRAPSRW